MAKPKKTEDGGAPSVTPVLDHKTATAQSQRQVAQAEKNRKRLLAVYKAEEKVPMYLSPQYRHYFGNVMRIMINGISIFFEVNGRTQMVPQSFADEITSRRLQIDSILTKQSRMANVQRNHEHTPGDLKLF